MKISERTPVGELLQASSEVRELLVWYGVEVDAIEPSTRLDRLCERLGLDIDDLCVELEVLFFDLDQRSPR